MLHNLRRPQVWFSNARICAIKCERVAGRLRRVLLRTLLPKTAAERHIRIISIKDLRFVGYGMRHRLQDDNDVDEERLKVHETPCTLYVKWVLNKWRIFTYHTRLLGKPKVLIEKLYHNNQIFNVYVYFEHTSVSFSHSRKSVSPEKKRVHRVWRARVNETESRVEKKENIIG